MNGEEAAVRRGPLVGLKIIEISGIGPLPFCAMLLADLGADIIRIDRPGPVEQGIGVDPERSTMHRSRAGLPLDLKSAAGRERFGALLEKADVLLEAMRPGTAEKLGIGPADCLARNPQLVYGRISGWGRSGALADAAGHDINYIAQSGLLSLMGPSDRPPVPPLASGADFPAGFLLALGIVAAIAERNETGKGRVVDQSLVGAASLYAATFRAIDVMGLWSGGRGGNTLDGGAPYYRCYETADGKFMAVGALEQRFYDEMVQRLGLDGELPSRRDRANWHGITEALAKTFRSRTRDQWCEVFRGSDACVTPVLDLHESVAAADDNGYPPLVERAGVAQSLPQPEFGSATEATTALPLPQRSSAEAALERWGVR